MIIFNNLIYLFIYLFINKDILLISGLKVNIPLIFFYS